MNIKNVEFKAWVDDLNTYEKILIQLGAQYIGTDHQIDTYFITQSGRLKLREGNIENALIQYERADTTHAKLSSVILYKHKPDKALKDILTLQLSIKTIVDKIRKIFYIDNVKFHLDTVAELGTFIEVEAIDDEGKYCQEDLQKQCEYYYNLFALKKSSLQHQSYSDMILLKKLK